MKRIRGFLFFILFLLNPSCAYPEIVQNNHVEAELISEAAVISNHEPFWIALRLRADEGWHTYWKNPGDSGLATTIQWNLPEGFKAGDIVWPVPQKITEPPLTTYGYGKEVYLLTKIEPPSDLKEGETIEVDAKVQWLACENICVPGHGHFSLEIPTGSSKKENTLWKEFFLPAQQNFPLPKNAWEDAWDFQFQITPQQIILHLIPKSSSCQSLSEIYFFPENQQIIDHQGQQIFSTFAGDYTLTIPRSQISSEPLDELAGILVNPNGWIKDNVHLGLEIHLSSVDLAEFRVFPESSLSFPASEKKGLAVILLFAFLGGVILNGMPCVLPVLSLKLLNLVEVSRGDSKRSWRESLVFTLGILVSLWILAAALIVFKSAGHHLGWGFQFQSSEFVIVLSALFFLLALNLIGVFEIPGLALGVKSSRDSGFKESFFMGILATISATPCTAPFMGAALGFALTQPPHTAFLIFSCLGLGLAFPYLLVGRFPQLLRFIPRPGIWMVHLKKILGFFLMASVVWLLWILGIQHGTSAVITVLSGFLFLGMGSWILGTWGIPASPSRIRRAAYLLFFVFLGVGLGIAFQGLGSNDSTRFSEMTRFGSRVKQSDLDWEPYTEERLQTLLSQGKIVFLDFTAAWCLSCQVNERTALRHPEIIRRFKALDVHLLKADWTTYDEKITEALGKFGKNSIPFYVLFAKNSMQNPVILPELLTPAIVLEALDKIAQNR